MQTPVQGFPQTMFFLKLSHIHVSFHFKIGIPITQHSLSLYRLLCLSYLSTSIYIYLYISLSISISTSLYLSIYIYLSLSIYLSINP